MDLKIKDVADLLNVSETTVRRWLGDGKIPAYRLDSQYRFSRVEIEDWLMSHKVTKESDHPLKDHITATVEKGHEQPALGSKQFSLYRALHKGKVLYDVEGNTKEEVIKAAVEIIAKDLHVDADLIADLLLEREKLQSTGLNNGLAIPHTRDFLLNGHFDVVTVVTPKKPIDYDSLDGKPVHTLFFLFASDDRHHLHLLAKIAHLSSQPALQALLRERPTKERFLDFIKEWESHIGRHA
jgi:PTS system nitrogen regulatory IIA component